MAITGLARSIDEAGLTASGYAPRARWPLIVPVVLMHGVVLAVVAAANLGAPVARGTEASLVTFDVASPPSQPSVVKSEAKPAAVVLSVIEPPVVVQEQPVALAVAPAQLEAIPVGGCDLTDVVQSALRASGAARDAIAMLPSADRSVANAVMIWDGHWVDAGTDAGRIALTQIRQVVRDTVMAASAECRTQLQGGPRLIAIPGSPDVTLAMGSGRWRWDDLGTTEIAMTEPVRAGPIDQ